VKVLVTGATGFIGKHVVAVLRKLDGCTVMACGRRERELQALRCPYAVHDLHEDDADCFHRLGRPDAVIHLAWESLSDYQDRCHFEQQLTAHYRFLKAMVVSGTWLVACAGTCLEYGLQYGPLAEDFPTRPTTAYGIAKDALRRFLEFLCHEHDYRLRWLRLFFTFGPGQPGRALLPQLDRAIDSGASSFAMSGGEQLRDYLPVEAVAEYIVKVALQREVDGSINICRGAPISVHALVENRMRERGGRLELKRGRNPYREYEPLAFWGDDRRLRQALAGYDDGRCFVRWRGVPPERRPQVPCISRSA
jgi:nucleoside-diphosphate-sugar epimerase